MFMSDEFEKYIVHDQNILVICSRPLDFDSICSGIILKKYLESLGKTVTAVFPRQLEESQKKFNQFLPYFDQLESHDTREMLIKKKYDLLILLDGANLIQFYDNDNKNLPAPDLGLYPRRIRIDHHLNSPENIGTYDILDSKTSSTVELILTHLVPENFIDHKIATLGYAALIQDTGNFMWNYYPSTFKLASLLLERGADFNLVLEKMFFSFSKLHFDMLGYAVAHTEYDKELKTAFLFMSKEKMEEDKIDEKMLGELKDVFLWDIARRVEGFPRGFILYEKEPGIIRGSARGNTANKIDLTTLIKEIGGNGGGHFNASGFSLNGTFETIKNNLLSALRKHVGQISG